MSNDEMKKGGSLNPFNTYDAPFQFVPQKPWEPFSASSVSSKKEQIKRSEISATNPTAVSFPTHLYPPENVQTVDLRRLANVPPGAVVDLIRFIAPQGGITRFINYAVFFDALLFNLIDLVPLVNNVRVFPFHGDPQSNFKIGLGTGSDLSNANLISCLLDLQPKDVLVWRFTNNDVVDVAAGVRMVGYYDQTTIRKQGRFGG